jgi:hypothetical protein
MNIPFTIKSGIEITKKQPYLHSGQNRRARRLRQPPFIGNGKQYPITVSGKLKYLRHIQITPDGKKIMHYLSL